MKYAFAGEEPEETEAEETEEEELEEDEWWHSVINFSSFFSQFFGMSLHWSRQYFSEAAESPGLLSLGYLL